MFISESALLLVERQFAFSPSILEGKGYGKKVRAQGGGMKNCH